MNIHRVRRLTFTIALSLATVPSFAQTLPGRRVFVVDDREITSPQEACGAIAAKSDGGYNTVAGARDAGGQYLWCSLRDKDGNTSEQHHGVASVICPPNARNPDINVSECECESGYAVAGGQCINEQSVVTEIADQRRLTLDCIQPSDQILTPPKSVEEAQLRADNATQRRVEAEETAARALMAAEDAGRRAGQTDASSEDEQAATRAWAAAQDAEIVAMRARLEENTERGYLSGRGGPPPPQGPPPLQQRIQIVPERPGQETVQLCDSPTIPGQESPGAQSVPPPGR